MSLKAKLEKIAGKLREFENDTDDARETTPSILRNIASFVEDDLEDLIDAVDKAADEAGSLEERIEELENEQEDDE